MSRLLLLLVLLGCERPRAYVICHNANCVGSEPFLDDTVQMLRRSLALRWNGQMLLDGIELDLLWDGTNGRCAFAHDPARAAASFGALEAAEEVALAIRASPMEHRFFVKLDMKAATGPRGAPLTDDEATAHADCALGIYERLAATAAEVAQPLTVLFESEHVPLVQRVTERPHYPGKRTGELVQTGLMVPIHADAQGLSIDVVSLEASRITPESHGRLRELRTRDIAVMVWMYDADPSVFGAIEEAKPTFVNTNEALLMREWLGERPSE